MTLPKQMLTDKHRDTNARKASGRNHKLCRPATEQGKTAAT